MAAGQYSCVARFTEADDAILSCESRALQIVAVDLVEGVMVQVQVLRGSGI